MLKEIVEVHGAKSWKKVASCHPPLLPIVIIMVYILCYRLQIYLAKQGQMFSVCTDGIKCCG